MSIKNLAIIGAGTMGGGIAISCLAAGLPTIVIDTNNKSLDILANRVKAYFDRQLSKQKITKEEGDQALSLLRLTTDLSSIGSVELIIEAVFEDLEIKRTLFNKLKHYLPDSTIVATNTSALRVSDLASSISYPERFLGLHYFSPAEINPLVELVKGDETDKTTQEKCFKFLEATGKTALQCKDANGFVVNRFFCPFTNEAVRLHDERIGTTAQIDKVAIKVFDLAIGPFAVMNIIKPRINLNAINNLSSHGVFYKPANGMIEIGNSDKSWIIEDNPEKLTSDEESYIENRLKGALFLPILQALSEEITKPNEFDVGAQLALRFGKPPIQQMLSIGSEMVVKLVQPYAIKYNVKNVEKGLSFIF